MRVLRVLIGLVLLLLSFVSIASLCQESIPRYFWGGMLGGIGAAVIGARRHVRSLAVMSTLGGILGALGGTLAVRLVHGADLNLEASITGLFSGGGVGLIATALRRKPPAEVGGAVTPSDAPPVLGPGEPPVTPAA